MNGKLKIENVKLWSRFAATALILHFTFYTLHSSAATMLNYMSGTNEVYTAAETDAAIVRLAPAPGNYAAVSNAAMNAASHTDAATNALLTALTRPFSEGGAIEVGAAGHATEATSAYVADTLLDKHAINRTGPDILDQLDAATATNAAQTAALESQASQLSQLSQSLSGKASTSDVQLTPVYGGNGERLSEWTYSGMPDGATIILYPSWIDTSGAGTYGWSFAFRYNNVFYVCDITSGVDGSERALELPCYPDGDGSATPVIVTATRTENPIVGYTLGSQTNKVLSSTNDLARASDLAAIRSIADAAASTNAAQQAALSTHASQLSQQSQSLSTLSSQVSAIGAHLNAEDARFVSTNYNSATHMPEAYVEVKITENGVSSWLTVWREMTRWDWFLGIYTNQYAELSAALANKGEKEYAFYDGVTGEPAPDGFFWIAQPRVAVAAGMSYQRYVDTGGAVWVLESNGMVADVNGTTNGFFRISDDDGNTQFEIVKGSSRIVAAAPGAMTHESVMGVTHWFTTYAVTNAASAPVAMFCRDIGSQEWPAETDGDCPCNVSWTNPESGVYVCEWWPKATEPRMYMKAKYGQGTESRIVQSAPVEMQYIVINGVKYTLGTATISGNTVLTLSPAAP